MPRVSIVSSQYYCQNDLVENDLWRDAFWSILYTVVVSIFWGVQKFVFFTISNFRKVSYAYKVQWFWNSEGQNFTVMSRVNFEVWKNKNKFRYLFFQQKPLLEIVYNRIDFGELHFAKLSVFKQCNSYFTSDNFWLVIHKLLCSSIGNLTFGQKFSTKNIWKAVTCCFLK